MAKSHEPWAERYNRRTRALERQAAAAEYQANELDRLATAVETLALAQSIAASKVGSYGWGSTGLGTLFERLRKRLP